MYHKLYPDLRVFIFRAFKARNFVRIMFVDSVHISEGTHFFLHWRDPSVNAVRKYYRYYQMNSLSTLQYKDGERLKVKSSGTLSLTTSSLRRNFLREVGLVCVVSTALCKIN